MKRAIFLCVTLVAACGEEMKPPPPPLAPPKLALEPDSLEFADVELGTQPAKIVRVMNQGDKTLNVSSIVFDNTAFSASPTDLSISPKGGADLTISFDASQRASGRGTAILSSDDPSRPRATISLSATTRDCNLVASQYTLQFNESDPDISLFVTNLGSDACTVQSIALPDPTTFIMTLPSAAPIAIAAGESIAVNLSWPDRLSSVIETLSIASDDPAEPTLEVQLVGWSYFESRPCVEVIYSSFFDLTPVGSAASAVLGLHNLSPADCELVSISFLDTTGMITGQMREPKMTLAPGEIADFVVFFRPTMEGSFYAQGTIETQGGQIQYLSIGASSYQPSVCVEPHQLFLADAETSSVTISACGATPAYINAIYILDNGTIHLEGAETPLTLSPGQTRTLRLHTDEPGVANTFMLEIESSDFNMYRNEVRVSVGQLAPLSVGRFIDIDDGRFGTLRQPLQGWPGAEPMFPFTMNDHSHSTSPDGRFLSSILSEFAGVVRIYDPLRLVNNTIADIVDGPIAWNPNVETLPAYQFAYSDGHAILIGSVDENEAIRTVFATTNPVFAPAWGSQGSIAFLEVDAGSPVLHLVDDHGTELQALAGSYDTSAAPPAFSPDGRLIALTKGTGGITVVHADDLAQSTDLSMLSAGAFDPAFSADGSMLAFVRNSDVYLVAIDPQTGVPTGAEVSVYAGTQPQHPTFAP